MSYSPFEPELRAFESVPAPQNATVFYGSSSIRLWEDIAQAFPGHTVVNRGFGGSTLNDCVQFIPRLLQPLSPATLVLYAADNDLDQGASPEHTAWLFSQFMERIRQLFPAVPIAYISVKPSPARYANISNIRRSNELIAESISAHPGVTYLDLFSHMLSPEGGSRPDLFTEDGLHMNQSGYDLWAIEIRKWLNTLPSNGIRPIPLTAA